MNRWTVALITLAAACGGRTNNSNAPDGAPVDAIAADTAAVTDTAAADTILPPPSRRSCAANAPGAGFNCGVSTAADCCAADVIPGGSYLRFHDGKTYASRDYPATISSFRLENFEVTVGRFRAWVAAYAVPAPSTGAHPLVAGSGWQATWPAATDGAALRAALMGSCDGGPRNWTDKPTAAEHLPMNCVTWYEAFAFCAWDGGRLPTATERSFAASGGSEQRVYPWSQPPASSEIDQTYALFALDVFKPPAIEGVGSRLKGAGRWGHLDLAGSVFEWALDVYGSGDLPRTCVNCALLSGKDDTRTILGGSFANLKEQQMSANREIASPSGRRAEVGFRCAH